MDEIESKIIRDFIGEAMDSGFECTPTFSMDENEHEAQLWFCSKCHRWCLTSHKPKYCPYCRCMSLGYGTSAKFKLYGKE